MLEILKTCQIAMQMDRFKLEQSTHNIASLQTPGFKRQVQESNPFLPMVTNAGPQRHVMTQGTLTETNRTLDLAISGKGFFTLQTAKGVAYTRRGDFQLNAQSALTTADGHLVLGQNGPIHLPSLDIHIDTKGRVFHQNEQIDEIQIAFFEEDKALSYIGEGLYESNLPPKSHSSTLSQINQGYLEESNVKTQEEMLYLMETSRHFETTQRVLKSVDEMLSSAIKEMES